MPNVADSPVDVLCSPVSHRRSRRSTLTTPPEADYVQTPGPEPQNDPVDASTPVRAPTGTLSALEVATIGQLTANGLSPHQIASLLSRSPDAVKRHLTEARQLLQALTPDAVIAWHQAMTVAASKGFHQPAMDLLIATDLVASPRIRPHIEGGPGTVINIGIGLPGLPVSEKVVRGQRVEDQGEDG